MKVYEFVVGLSVFLAHSLPSIIGAEKCFGRPSASNKLPSEMLTSGASEYDDDDVEAFAWLLSGRRVTPRTRFSSPSAIGLPIGRRMELRRRFG